MWTGIKITVVIALVVAVVGSFIWYTRGQWIEPGYVGIITGPSGLGKEVIPPKRVVVPWMHTLYKYPTKVMAAVYSDNPNYQNIRTGEQIAVTTKENANIPFDVVVWYSVRPENVPLVYKNFGGIPIEDIQRQHIRGATKDAAGNVGVKTGTYELVGTDRQEASNKLTAELKALLEYKGITIHKACFMSCNTDALKARVLANVNAQTELKSASIKRDIAAIQNQINMVQSTADATAQRLSAGTTRARSIRMTELDNQLAAAEKWSGKLAPIQPGVGPVFIDRSAMQALGASGGG